MYEVVWPRGKRTRQSIPLSKRPDTLAGKTVCELWNGGFRGDETFPILREELKKRFPDIKIVPWEEFGKMGGPFEDKILAELPAKMKSKGCDVAIAGNGC
jgi:hypothetical protein